MKPRTLLLLHGALGSRSQFETLVPLLDREVDVRTPEFEGHGSEPDPGRGFRVGHFVGNITGYMDREGIDRASIFGYSLGGFVGLALAAEYPRRVAGVFTLATKILWTTEVALKEAGQCDAEKIIAKVPQFAAELERRHPVAGWRSVLDNTRGFLLELGIHNPLQHETLARIQAPVRIGCGENDPLVPPAEASAVSGMIPGSTVEVFPASPHAFERYSSEALAASIVSFVRSLDT